MNVVTDPSVVMRTFPFASSAIDLGIALQIAAELAIYAYDAYLITCARQTGSPLLTVDRGLVRAARRLGVQVLEVS